MHNYKSLFDAIEELKEKSKDGWVIIVEGARDLESLRKLGIEGEIVVFSGFTSTAEVIGCRNSIIMTDCDNKGREIEKGLVRTLQSYGKTPNVEIKRKIFSNVRKEISKVEELHSFVLKIQEIKNSK